MRLVTDRGVAMSHGRQGFKLLRKWHENRVKRPWTGGAALPSTAGCCITSTRFMLHPRFQAVAWTLNNWPRQTLGRETPIEVLNEYLNPFDNPVLQRLVESALNTSEHFLRLLSA